VKTSLGLLPGPAQVWEQAGNLWTDHLAERAKARAFYERQEKRNAETVAKDPNAEARIRPYTGKPTFIDQIITSLQTVFTGFLFATVVAVPLGIMCGLFVSFNAALNPLVQIFKPVSPLAWLPIGLLVLKRADPAAIWVIFICSLWPMIVNTAVGVRQIPQDYLNVARVLNLSEWKVFTRILFPAVLPYMITGVRLSIGVAWLVIVAAEMLTGGVGIGFWVWDEWNNLKVEHIIIAIFTIGMVGLLLEQALVLLARRFSYAA